MGREVCSYGNDPTRSLWEVASVRAVDSFRLVGFLAPAVFVGVVFENGFHRGQVFAEVADVILLCVDLPA